jgi:hypothetical protein
MAQNSEYPSAATAMEGYELGLEFLRARRAQNLSWMRFVEQSLRTLAEVQKGAGAGGDPLVRLSLAQAGVVRETAGVYRTMTAHLAR